MKQEYENDVKAMMAACKKPQHVELQHERILKDAEALVVLLEETYRTKCCVMFDRLKSNLSSPKKHLNEDDMRVYTQYGDGSVTAIFRIMQPRFLRRLVRTYEWLDENNETQLAERILCCVLPYIQHWIALIDQLSIYYHDKNRGKTLKNLFAKLQGKCKWFATNPLVRIKEGRILSDDYSEAWGEFTDFYATRLPLTSNVVDVNEKLRLEVISEAHSYMHERLLEALRGNDPFNFSAVIKEFYNKTELWEEKKWIVNGVRRVYGEGSTKEKALAQRVYSARTKEEKDMVDAIKSGHLKGK